MNVLLIRPDSPKESINLQSFMICEPLELEYLAASLKLAGHTVHLVDMLLEKPSISRLLKEIEYENNTRHRRSRLYRLAYFD